MAKERDREEKLIEKLENNDSEDDDDDGYNELDEPGIVGVAKRFGRGFAYRRTFHALRAKSSAAAFIKRMFGTDFTDAIEDAKKLNNPKVRGKRQARAKAYNCPWCDYWHVGHDNKLVPLWKQNRSKYGNRK